MLAALKKRAYTCTILNWHFTQDASCAHQTIVAKRRALLFLNGDRAGSPIIRLASRLPANITTIEENQQLSGCFLENASAPEIPILVWNAAEKLVHFYFYPRPSLPEWIVGRRLNGPGQSTGTSATLWPCWPCPRSSRDPWWRPREFTPPGVFPIRQTRLFSANDFGRGTRRIVFAAMQIEVLLVDLTILGRKCPAFYLYTHQWELGRELCVLVRYCMVSYCYSFVFYCCGEREQQNKFVSYCHVFCMKRKVSDLVARVSTVLVRTGTVRKSHSTKVYV